MAKQRIAQLLLGALFLIPSWAFADQVVILECDSCETVAQFRVKASANALGTLVPGNYLVINHTSQKAAEFLVTIQPSRGGGRPVLTDGEVDSELGDKYGVITLNARKIAPLRLPDSRLTNTGGDSRRYVNDRNDPTMATLVKQWI